MAEHKAPTDVTVVAYEEKSAFAAFVERHWVKAAIIAVMVTGFILWQQFKRGQEAAQIDESWNKLMAAVDEVGGGGFRGDPDALNSLSQELEGTIAGPWALFLRSQNLREEGAYDEAIATLIQLQSKYPEHSLVKDTYAYGESITPLSAVEHMSKVFESEKEWRGSQPHLFSNPEPPTDSPRVRIVTEQGDIVVAMYTDRAPLHSANFISHVEAGFYDGIAFHRLTAGQRIQAGDPESKNPESNPLTWGKGSSEEATESEDTGLSHFRGYLSADALPGGEGTSVNLFSITAGGAHPLDGRNVVFGKVIDGQGVVEDISSLPADQTTQIPLETIKIISMTVVPGA